MDRLDLTNQSFGKLIAVQLHSLTSQGQSNWLCRCECGNEKVVFVGNLRSGKQTSCGCSRNGNTSAMRHGHNRHSKPTRTYRSWEQMKARCYSEYKESSGYRARGIIVCEQWRASFEQFLSDMGERPMGKTLDRINNDGNYEPSNCKWSTPKEQANNRRKPKRRSKNQSDALTTA